MKYVLGVTDLAAIVPGEELGEHIVRLREKAGLLEQILADGFQFDDYRDDQYWFATEDAAIAAKNPLAKPESSLDWALDDANETASR